MPRERARPSEPRIGEEIVLFHTDGSLARNGPNTGDFAHKSHLLENKASSDGRFTR